MFNADDFQYAMENTQVVLAPETRIQTLGSVSFRFYLIAELMDEADKVRVRDGRIDAERPQIVTAANAARLLLEGFGEKGQEFAAWVERQKENLALLRYGFQFKKSGVTESIVRSPMAEVVERVREQVVAAKEPTSVIIQGVDDAWEVCLMKFTMEMVQQSAGENMGDLRRRGLL